VVKRINGHQVCLFVVHCLFPARFRWISFTLSFVFIAPVARSFVVCIHLALSSLPSGPSISSSLSTFPGQVYPLAPSLVGSLVVECPSQVICCTIIKSTSNRFLFLFLLSRLASRSRSHLFMVPLHLHVQGDGPLPKESRLSDFVLIIVLFITCPSFLDSFLLQS